MPCTSRIHRTRGLGRAGAVDWRWHAIALVMLLVMRRRVYRRCASDGISDVSFSDSSDVLAVQVRRDCIGDREYVGDASRDADVDWRWHTRCDRIGDVERISDH